LRTTDGKGRIRVRHGAIGFGLPDISRALPEWKPMSKPPMSFIRWTLLSAFTVLLPFAGGCGRGRPSSGELESYPEFPTLDQEAASVFANLALNGITREYPNKLDHVMNGPSEVKSPAALHPVFFGSYDWHSCVHGYWLLVRLLKLYPDLPEGERIRETLNGTLTPANVAAEVAYLDAPNRASFERTYGWAWLLKLAEELRGWEDEDGLRWGQILQPMADAMVDRYTAFLPKQDYPIRRGVHPNTAFGIAFALDYARAAGDEAFEGLLLERTRSYFSEDKDYPAEWEPDGDDFFSRSLIEADLMRRVLPPDALAGWLRQFLPGLESGQPASLLTPAEVSDRTDPKIVHLDGLNLSRAWCMRLVAESLPQGDSLIPILMRSAEAHARATLPHIDSGNYEGEHWLGTFAVYMLTE